MENGAGIKAQFARDARLGLCTTGPKSLPAKYLYDTIGSALFETITHLPDYGLTRADKRLLQRCASTLPRRFEATKVVIAELGSGVGSKTRLILEAFSAEQILYYSPIDVSCEALRLCERELSDIARVRGHVGPYLEGVASLKDSRPDNTPLLLLFLGSSIGNFDADERTMFLGQIRSHLRPGDHILIGFDLVKPRSTLLKAYDDPTGVTAAFNRNVLGRINRELGAAFDLASFSHLARYNERHQRVEMHLRSETAQRVQIPESGATCTLAPGETIWTESSYKFRIRQIRQLMAEAGFGYIDEWIDDDWPFMEGLWAVAAQDA